MSARKLGRLAGLVFVLAAVFGGVNAAGYNAAHGAEATNTAAQAAQTSQNEVTARTLEVVWE
jgi:hypothetical protein